MGKEYELFSIFTQLEEYRLASKITNVINGLLDT